MGGERGAGSDASDYLPFRVLTLSEIEGASSQTRLELFYIDLFYEN